MKVEDPDQMKHTILLERLRLRHLKESAKPQQSKISSAKSPDGIYDGEDESERSKSKKRKKKKMVENFEELGLSEEVMGALREMNIEVPTEIQCIGIPAVLERKSVVLGSHTGSGKTLAYLLPLVQVLDEADTMFDRGFGPDIRLNTEHQNRTTKDFKLS